MNEKITTTSNTSGLWPVMSHSVAVNSDLPPDIENNHVRIIVANTEHDSPGDHDNERTILHINARNHKATKILHDLARARNDIARDSDGNSEAGAFLIHSRNVLDGIMKHGYMTRTGLAGGLFTGSVVIDVLWENMQDNDLWGNLIHVANKGTTAGIIIRLSGLPTVTDANGENIVYNPDIPTGIVDNALIGEHLP